MMRPRKSEQTTTLLPTNIEMRAPQIKRERMSRPSSSVPQRCCDEGGCSRWGRSMWAGSWGAIQGAKRAQRTNTTTDTTPTAANGLWRARRGSEMAAVDIGSCRVLSYIHGNWRDCQHGILVGRGAMSNVKQDVESLLNRLPDNVSVEDIQYHLFVLDKVRRGLEDARVNGTLSQEEVESRFNKWLTE